MPTRTSRGAIGRPGALRPGTKHGDTARSGDRLGAAVRGAAAGGREDKAAVGGRKQTALRLGALSPPAHPEASHTWSRPGTSTTAAARSSNFGGPALGGGELTATCRFLQPCAVTAPSHFLAFSASSQPQQQPLRSSIDRRNSCRVLLTQKKCMQSFFESHIFDSEKLILTP